MSHFCKIWTAELKSKLKDTCLNLKVILKQHLTEVAREVGSDRAPKIFFISPKVQAPYGMKKYVNEICLPYLVPEIWLFVYICLHFEAESQIVPKHLKMVPSEKFFYILLPKVVFSGLQFIKGQKNEVYKLLIRFFVYILACK